MSYISQARLIKYNGQLSSKCIGEPANCEHALHYSMLSYAHIHMNSFIFQVNTPDILGMVLEFETMFFVDLV